MDTTPTCARPRRTARSLLDVAALSEARSSPHPVLRPGPAPRRLLVDVVAVSRALETNSRPVATARLVADARPGHPGALVPDRLAPWT